MIPTAPKILIVRTDSIGDVMLTLPMCGWIKQHIPNATIYFLGRTYTESIVQHCTHVDVFLNADEWLKLDDQAQIQKLSALQCDIAIHVFPVTQWMRLTQRAKIPMRIATSHRISSWRFCTHRVAFSRRRSALHEAQLNLKLLRPLRIPTEVELNEMPSLYGFHAGDVREENQIIPKSPEKINICLHPFSQGSAVEWPLASFQDLVQLFDPIQTHFYVTGTAQDLQRYEREGGLSSDHVTCVMGTMSLSELISFISESDGMIAASTGPLHIAAALDVVTVGVYSSAPPIHAGRWAPLGKFAEALEDRHAPTSGSLVIPAEEVKQCWEKGYLRKKQQRN